MTASGLWAQIDVHSHAITESYMDFIRTHGAEMDEGFPIPSWKVEEHLAFMDKADPCKIYILEVYADREAYRLLLRNSSKRRSNDEIMDGFCPELFSDAKINFRNQKQAIYNLKNCNVLKISAEQKQSLA